jgi:hypothetical protein
VRSKGLAVVEETTNRFSGHEINNGSGSYHLDFMVPAARKGHEDHEVVRASAKAQSVDRGANRKDSPVQLIKRPGR